MHLETTDLLVDRGTALSIETYNALYATYCHSVYRNIMKLVKNENDAEDILQDVFVSLWENKDKLSDRSISGWLFIVSHNKAMDHLKKQLRLTIEQHSIIEEIADLSLDVHDREALYLEQLKMVTEAVDALPKRKREVFRLCRLEGYSKDDVAAMMGISYQSVSDYLKQSNKAIKAYIVENYPYAASGAIVAVAAFSA
ncbi:RNA polymerase sigma factor [Sphingobacterium bambusae]|uniref:RNA polymerase sigma factor n=1 Tax=Sphingobacterium bambusae TaxID=662858 RepID=A0ABW6BGM3_9SPHI|nr:sigma-70 family RNA polymerase sigma factor [Sphingobacterium bambusae]WPL49712.1 sigma-70 family RNA polymerase sigma factor [Sphingobacterium bambusae]